MSLIEEIKSTFPFSETEIKLLLITAPRRYKEHFIEKRKNRGKRLIAQPTSEVKVLQRWALEKYLSSLPIHESAMAYIKGKNIREHAQLHATNKYLLKLDFENFFPSIQDKDFLKHIKKHSSIDEVDSKFLSMLFFRAEKSTGKNILSIGAPSSPFISNTILYEFDTKLAEFCAIRGVTYSRYADDLAISTNSAHTLTSVYEYVEKLCKEINYPKVTLNKKKTVFTSTKYQRQLTGLILSNSGNASLGRDKKRVIRATAHHYLNSQLDEKDINKLRGLLAFAKSIDLKFYQSIKKLLGEDKFTQLMRR